MAKPKVPMRAPTEVAGAIDAVLAGGSEDAVETAGEVMKSINVRMPAALHKAVAQLALDEDTKINRLVIEGLRELLKGKGRAVP